MSEDVKKCPFCGEEILAQAQKCKYCGEWLNQDYVSSGGALPDKELPIEAKRYNWGVLFTGWIWGLCNGMPKDVLIASLALWLSCYIPFVNLATCWVALGYYIWAGTKGNQWAWNHKDWNSVEEFNKHQRKWVWIPLVIAAGLFIIIFMVTMFVAVLAAIAGAGN